MARSNIATPAAKAFAILAVLGCWAARPTGAAAGFLSNTAVTRNQFAADFDVTSGNQFLEEDIVLQQGEQAGKLRSQVFKGKGADLGLFAYLFQIQAPGMTGIESLFLDFPNRTQKATIAGMNNVTSIYINQGVGGGNMSIGGFTMLGNVAPLDVFQSNPPLPSSVKVTYQSGNMGAAIPAGGTGYIVGLFSKSKPGKVKILVGGAGKKDALINAYAPVPEPSTLLLVGLGGLGLLGGLLRRRGRQAV